MSSLVYPVTLDMHCATFILNALKNSTVMDDKQQFAACLWNVQGYLQGLLLGAPDTPDAITLSKTAHPTITTLPDETLPQATARTAVENTTLGQLAETCKSFIEEPQSFTDPNPSEGIDLTQLMVTIIPLILQILKALGYSI